jgi:membrane fusion protein (multidrug efflux system)
MKNIQKSFYLVLLTAAATTILNISCSGKGNQQGFAGMAPTVSVATVNYSTITLQREFQATLVSNKQIKLVTDVGGRVEDILFKEGGHVVRGQPLYNIDKRLYQAAYDEAVAQLKIAQTNLLTAQTDAQRYQNLWDHNAVDEIQLAHAKAQVEVAKATVDAAAAAVARANTNLEHATIVAPFNGATNVSNVRLGDLVVAYQTVLVTIVDNSNMRADFYVPEGQYVAMLSRNDHSGTSLPKFNLILPDGSLYPLEGNLDFLDNTVDPTTGTLLVRLIFPNPDNILKSGMSCVVRSEENNQQQKYLVIPQQAVQQVLNEYYVYVVNDSAVVMDRKITPGQSSNGVQIVTNGLKQGDRVIVEGIEKVRPNQQVKTVPYSEAAADTTQQSDKTKKD